ncbi:MAG TPA: LysE family translocator [Candidatus Sulfotelmatobacter sp.]|jgi:threonine/homoserine/homoserine lactone efflux protein|nr:LysE family translocator [Candidatus Sulfotelmatobacter sp.]
MSFNTWAAFALLFLVLSYTPGPNMLLAASHGMLFGPKRTIATAAGLIAGLWVWIGVSAAGVGAVLSASPQAFDIVRWAGSAYMAWLGYKALTAPPMDLENGQTEEGAGVTVLKRASQGLAVSLSNPKAIVIFTAVLPQFIDQTRPLLPQVGYEIATITVLEFSMIMSSATLSGRLVPWLKRSGRTSWINRISGGVLVVAAVLLAGIAHL